MVIYEDNDFIVTCSDTNFNKFVIFLNSAAGLDRIILGGGTKNLRQIRHYSKWNIYSF